MKANKTAFIFAAVLVVTTIFINPALCFLVLLSGWLISNLFFSDHIWYKRNSDTNFRLEGHTPQSLTFKGNQIRVNGEHENCSTLIKAKVASSFTGYFFDPHLIIQSEHRVLNVYFERGLNGYKYIDISPLLQDSSGETDFSLQLSAAHCRVNEKLDLYTFDNNEVNTSNLLVIAPHADDAEIAAFGLYQSTESHIVTLTAGEIEPETFKHFSSDPVKASRLKGLVRIWDSLSVPLWGKQLFTNSINLGYFCMQLSPMQQNKNKSFPSHTADLDDTRFFRKFNTRQLASDSDGKPTWNNLVSDLQELIDDIKPTAIVTPHTVIDSHPDHKAATYAVEEALTLTTHRPGHLLCYANHLETTDMFPFGPAHSLTSLPPIKEELTVGSVYSFTLSEEVQLNKAVALEMMHDLRRPVKAKKWLRAKLQSWFIGRKTPSYGHDPYFRKAVRANEIFIVKSLSKIEHES
ncbi:PIG-L family deacetylase [Endozoicomonas sp. OPT23]|uniref:PIG-L deacetylase family protein n=1 Tax=Endozoicomonas sp. OPT23 TaxID=2072845 RepID=UPI00129BE8A7|nr:PIG-L family deacetylase [Endozoicomonas sp. OPT23]MRI31603.1 PIG-L family deacetylase [Endozoicomonas sp. OPT23]